MKKLIPIVLSGLLGATFAHAAPGSLSSVATWKATAKKESVETFEVTPLSNLNFEYSAENKSFNAVEGLFNINMDGIAKNTPADVSSFNIKVKKLNGSLSHAASDSKVEIGVTWQGKPVVTTDYTTIVDEDIDFPTVIQDPDTGMTYAQSAFTFNVDKATVDGSEVGFDALPDGTWSGDVNVEFVASWV